MNRWEKRKNLNSFPCLQSLRIKKKWYHHTTNNITILANHYGSNILLCIEFPYDEKNLKQYPFEIVDNQENIYFCKNLDTNVKIFFPASESDISANKPQRFVCYTETPELYSYIHSHFIASLPEKHTRWILDILNGVSKENSKIIFENSNFCLLPDAKWDTKNVTDLHYLAIIKNTNIQCLRDLRANHIPLLEEIIEYGYDSIFRMHSIPQTSIKIFLHYHPSVYHLHIHFVYVDCCDMTTCLFGRSIMLRDIITNLKEDNEYYSKAILNVMLGTESNLFRFLLSNQKIDFCS